MKPDSSAVTTPASPSRHLTVLMLDWKGSTRLHDHPRLGRTAGQRAAAVQSQVEHPFQDRLAECTREAGGTPEGFAGDAYVFAFASPQEAVLCALVLQWRLRKNPIPTPAGPLAIRVGLHTAEVIERHTPPGHFLQPVGQYIQQAANYAARAMSLAAAGQVVATEVVEADCRQGLPKVSFQDLGEQTLKPGERAMKFFLVQCPDPECRRASKEFQQSAEDHPMQPQPGDLFGDARWCLVKPIGKGGESTVWEATRTDTQGHTETVALKVFRADLLRQPEVREALTQWFKDSVTNLLKIRHAQVVRYRDAGWWLPLRSHLRVPFLVMDLVPGVKITEALHSQPLDVTLPVFLQVCEAVDVIHGRELLHLDLKPANLLVETTPKGFQPVVVDFGLAQPYRSTRPADPERFGQGTLAYMAPEQISRKHGAISPATDVYALGVILFELLTGQHPCDLRAKRTEAAARRAILAGPKLSLFDLRPNLCDDRRHVQELSAILDQALRAGSQPHFGEASQLVEALRKWLKQTGGRQNSADAGQTAKPPVGRLPKVNLQISQVTGPVIGNVEGDYHHHGTATPPEADEA